MSYCNTEVQTSDLLENESDDVDPMREPIENLSVSIFISTFPKEILLMVDLLTIPHKHYKNLNFYPFYNFQFITTQLLHRTELQQRIAENINKARESSSSFHENQEHENGQDAANASMLSDYNNAIKSIVEATDSDPIFEDFIHEIFNVGDINEKLEENKQTQVSNDQFDTRYLFTNKL